MGSGPEKYSPRNPFGSDLRFYGQNNSNQPLSFNPYNLNAVRHLQTPISPNILPHPFIAHFYPMLGAQNQFRRNLNPQNPQNPVAALASLATSNASESHFASEVLNDFQNGNFHRELLNLELMNQHRNLNQQNSSPKLENELLVGDLQRYRMMNQPEKQSGGLDVSGSSIHPAWGEFLRRIGTQNSTENSPTDEKSFDILFQSKSADHPRRCSPDKGANIDEKSPMDRDNVVTSQMDCEDADDKECDVEKEHELESSFSFKAFSRSQNELSQEGVVIDPGTFKRRYSSSSSNQSRDDLPRPRRRKRAGEVKETCPVCGVTVRPCELSSHLSQEMEKFVRLPDEFRKKMTSNRRYPPSEKQASSSTGLPVTSSLRKFSEKDLLMREDHGNRLKTFIKVRSNRVGRLNTRVGHCFRAERTLAGTNNFPANVFHPGSSWKNNNLPPNVDDSCPCCFAELRDLSAGEIGAHIEQCFGRRTFRRDPNDTTEHDDDVMIDVESPVDLTRIFETHRNITSSRDGVENELQIRRASFPAPDQELDVESDDSRSYGASQFNESNLDVSKLPSFENVNRNDNKLPEKSNFVSSAISDVSSLQLKVEKLENEKKAFRCMICMDSYHNPVTSIQCWHVYCETCWLRALAVKKLCPKCKAITPVDKLRRLYL